MWTVHLVFVRVCNIILKVITGGCDSDFTETGTLKRKGSVKHETSSRRSKQPAYFIAELAHVVAMCDERLPFVSLSTEVSKTKSKVNSVCGSVFCLLNFSFIISVD